MQDLDNEWQDFLLDVISNFLSNKTAPSVQYSAVMCSIRLLSFQTKWCERTGSTESILDDVVGLHLSLPSRSHGQNDESQHDQFPSEETVQKLAQKFLSIHAQKFPHHFANCCIYQICKAAKSGVLLVCSCPKYGSRLENNVAKERDVQELKRVCYHLLCLLYSESTAITLEQIYQAVQKNLSQVNVSLAGIQAWVEERVGIDFNCEEDFLNGKQTSIKSIVKS